MSFKMKSKVIVCSDRASVGTYEDKSGPAASGWLSANGYNCEGVTVIPDNPAVLTETVLAASCTDIDFLVISGGTGIGPTDITPQTLAKICDYEVAGFGEMLRRESLKYSKNAYLSRCGGWVLKQKLIFALPGNPKAVCEQLDMLKDLLPHAVDAVQGKCKSRRPVGTET
jgi:molybdenum cofactor synthesis domain-containing protein